MASAFQSDAFQTNAFQSLVTQTSSFTADAVLLRIQTPAFTTDGVLLSTQSVSFTADAVLSATQTTSLTADAFIQLYFTADAYISAGGNETAFSADAVLLLSRSDSFTADAVLLVSRSTSFTADADLFASISASVTADSVLLKTQSASFAANSALVSTTTTSFTANAVLKKTGIAASFTADAIRRKTQSTSFTANATKQATISRSLSADAYIKPPYVIQHARTGPHIGVDTELANYVAWAFDRYLRGQPLREVLIDLDARLSAREAGFYSPLLRLYAYSVIQVNQTTSYTASALLAIPQSASFTTNAVMGPGFQANAWIVDPSYAIVDNVALAQTWDIESGPKAAIKSAVSLTHDAVNDPNWWDNTYLSGWAKFTLTSTQLVQIDGIGSQGDTVIQLWTGSPGAWAAEPIYADDFGIDDSLNPYGFSPYVQVVLDPGTYYVAIHAWDEPPSPDFNIQLRMQIV